MSLDDVWPEAVNEKKMDAERAQLIESALAKIRKEKVKFASGILSGRKKQYPRDSPCIEDTSREVCESFGLEYDAWFVNDANNGKEFVGTNETWLRSEEIKMIAKFPNDGKDDSGDTCFPTSAFSNVSTRAGPKGETDRINKIIEDAESWRCILAMSTPSLKTNLREDVITTLIMTKAGQVGFLLFKELMEQDELKEDKDSLWNKLSIEKVYDQLWHGYAHRTTLELMLVMCRVFGRIELSCGRNVAKEVFRLFGTPYKGMELDKNFLVDLEVALAEDEMGTEQGEEDEDENEGNNSDVISVKDSSDDDSSSKQSGKRSKCT
jgi:hypothetical protein